MTWFNWSSLQVINVMQFVSYPTPRQPLTPFRPYPHQPTPRPLSAPPHPTPHPLSAPPPFCPTPPLTPFLPNPTPPTPPLTPFLPHPTPANPSLHPACPERTSLAASEGTYWLHTSVPGIQLTAAVVQPPLGTPSSSRSGKMPPLCISVTFANSKY